MQVSYPKTVLVMALFVIAGIPLVAYLWETLNQILSLEVGGKRLLISLPILLVLLGILWVMAKFVRRWQPDSQQRKPHA